MRRRYRDNDKHMQYKITVRLLKEDNDYSGTDVYEQIIEDLDVQAVIRVANAIV